MKYVSDIRYDDSEPKDDPVADALSALKVIELTPHILAYLQAKDPMALRQVRRAIEGLESRATHEILHKAYAADIKPSDRAGVSGLVGALTTRTGYLDLDTCSKTIGGKAYPLERCTYSINHEGPCSFVRPRFKGIRGDDHEPRTLSHVRQDDPCFALAQDEADGEMDASERAEEEMARIERKLDDINGK